jgi:hypothetical protein
MTVEEYTKRRAELRERYGDNAREAGIRREQELARLFYVSGWSERELAEQEGVGKTTVHQWIAFGRFLDFALVAGATKSQNGLKTIKAKPFRTLYAQTDPSGNERQRFTAVLDMLAAPSSTVPRDLAKDIEAGQFVDGKWHLLADLATAFDEDPKVATAALEKLGKGSKHKLETKAVGNSFKFRLFKQERPIAVQEIAEKLGPIVKDLLTEGKKGPARINGMAVTVLANRLQKLLDEWRG